ncbi:VOC family protein [uncultured Mycolicibacterium sp.]|uniref:VOC family protein n=1 Tax=uncultured Mycolicibacterium sp. TaxID=2320817 RepID=UPI0026199014|nr:VOC family protein [uncultured Mycolicibacterium sp.]
MTVRTSIPVGAPIWIDLSTSDLARARRFYGTVFGWTFEETGPEYEGYVIARCDGRPVAGLMHNKPEWEAPDAWITYLHTADVDATVAAAVAAGASCCMGAIEVGDQGREAMLTDPTGAFVGLWQPGGHRGFEVAGRHGAPVWHQLTTRDFARALDFYRTVFGWQTQAVADTDEFRYATAAFDGDELLGVFDAAILPEGTPSSWNVFLGADDVDRAIEVIVAEGGTVVRPAEDTPYGRLASVTDPTGAAFNLSSLPD